MPFQSEKQRRYLWANEPEIARDWTNTYGNRIQKNDGGIMHHFQNYAQNDGNNVSVPRSFQARPQSEQVNLAYITPQEQQMLQALKPGTPHRGPMEIPNYDSFDAAGGYSNPGGAGDKGGYSASSGGGGGGWQASHRADAKVNEMAEQVRRNYVNKENIKSSPLHNRGLSLAQSGVGPNIGNWASGFAGSKIGGGLGSMAFGPWGMLLGSLFGRGVGQRAYRASQTDEEETLRDILFGQNTLLSNLVSKKKTPTNIGDEGLGLYTDRIKKPGGTGKRVGEDYRTGIMSPDILPEDKPYESYMDDRNLMADVSQSDIDILTGMGGITHESDPADIRERIGWQGNELNPTMTDQEIIDVLKQKITSPTGKFA